MIKERASLDSEDDDFSLFEAEPKLEKRFPSKEDIKAVSSKAGFPSREPLTNTLETPGEIKKDISRRRHYNASDAIKVQLNVRTTNTVADTFYKIANENEWSLGQTLKKALAALEREIGVKTQ